MKDPTSPRIVTRKLHSKHTWMRPIVLSIFIHKQPILHLIVPYPSSESFYQVLVGAMGNTPPIWMWCWGHFCCYSLLMDFVHLRVGPWPGFCTSTHGIHSFRFALSLRRCLSNSIFNFLLREVHFYSQFRGEFFGSDFVLDML